MNLWEFMKPTRRPRSYELRLKYAARRCTSWRRPRENFLLSSWVEGWHDRRYCIVWTQFAAVYTIISCERSQSGKGYSDAGQDFRLQTVLGNLPPSLWSEYNAMVKLSDYALVG